MIERKQPASPSISPDEDEVDLLELWDILIEKWQWIAGTTAIFAIGAIAVALWMTPIYRSEVLIVPAEDAGGKGGGMAALAGQFGGLAEMAGVRFGSGSSKDEAIALLKSRALVQEFIKEQELLPVLFEDEWDAAAKKWRSDDPKEIPTLNAAHELLNKSVLSVAEDKKSGLVTVSIEWKDRELAAQWANELVRRANQAMRKRAIEEAQGSIDYLNKELQKTSVVEIQQAIYRLLEANYKTVSVANAREQYAFKIIDPAVAPDANRRVRPKRSLIVIVATLVGGFVGVLGVFAYRGLSTMRRRRAERLVALNG